MNDKQLELALKQEEVRQLTRIADALESITMQGVMVYEDLEDDEDNFEPEETAERTLTFQELCDIWTQQHHGGLGLYSFSPAECTNGIYVTLRGDKYLAIFDPEFGTFRISQ